MARPFEGGRTESRAGTRTIAAWLLVALGLSSFVGYVTGSSPVRRYARATMASPLPLAFSDCGSLRALVHTFGVDVTTPDGTRLRRQADASIYAELPGPYERHVIYGAAVGLASITPSPVFRAILRHGFCGRGPLATAMGFERVLMGLGRPLAERVVGRVARAPSWGTVGIAMTAFMLAYGLSGLLDAWPTACTVVLGALFVAAWLRCDRSGLGLVLAALTAIIGTSVETLLVAVGGFRYLAPSLGLVAIWLPALYCCAAVGVDALGKRLVDG